MSESTADLERDESKRVVQCILCGQTVDPDSAVRYQDWICHPECANKTINQKIRDFNKKYLYIGAISALIGIVGSIIYFSVQLTTIYLTFIFGLSLVSITLGFIGNSIGLHGLHLNYNQIEGEYSAIIAAINAICFGGMSLIMLTFGLNPSFYNSETGVLLEEYHHPIGEVPSYGLIVLAWRMFFGFLSITVAITIWLLEKELKDEMPTKIFVFIFIANIALFIILPHSIIIFFSLMFWIFYKARVPKYWSKIER